MTDTDLLAGIRAWLEPYTATVGLEWGSEQESQEAADQAMEYIETLLAVCDAQREVVEAARRLKNIVEGVGGLDYGAWRDDAGLRLKDQKEWVESYNALAAHDATVERLSKERAG